MYFVRPLGQQHVQPSILNQGKFRELKIPNAKITVMDCKKVDTAIKFTVSNDSYAHAVHFNFDDSVNLSDEYFDLLPGECREVIVYNAPEGLAFTDIIPESMVKKSNEIVRYSIQPSSVM